MTTFYLMTYIVVPILVPCESGQWNSLSITLTTALVPMPLLPCYTYTLKCSITCVTGRIRVFLFHQCDTSTVLQKFDNG